ncbi:MAG: response regulator [Actinomycetota bacterium]
MEASGEGRARVLVVDDTPQIRLLLRLNLELEGFEVEEAGDGAACLERLRDAGRPLPQVVTLDAVMEPVDGWTAVQEIRRDPRLAHLPLVMITASVQAYQRARAQRAGVDAFVAKPFEPSAVVEMVRELSSSSRPAGRR